jgi:hypothetical protein
MTAREYESAIRERFVHLYPEPEFTVIGGPRCSARGRLSGVARQIDVGVVRGAAPDDLVLVADAKRHGTRLDVPDVEAFLGYLEDIGCPQGVLASVLGGSAGANRRATAARISLHVVSYAEAVSFDWPRVAAGLYPWDDWAHAEMAEALRLLNRGRTAECLDAVGALPFEEWGALFSRPPSGIASNPANGDHPKTGQRGVARDRFPLLVSRVG